MNRFAKLLKTPPKKRVVAALRGFGFTSAPAARGLGYVRTSATVSRLLQQQGMTAEAAQSVMQAPVLLAAPKLVAAAPTVYSPTATVASFERSTNLRQASPAPAPAPAPASVPVLVKDPSDGQVRVEDPLDAQAEEEEEDRFAEGTEDFIPPADTEEGEPDWSQYSGGGQPAADTEPKADGAKKKGIKKSAQTSGGLMAQIKALPMPVKVIGGIAVAYVVWKVLE